MILVNWDSGLEEMLFLPWVLLHVCMEWVLLAPRQVTAALS